MADPSKTEKATPKRRRDERKKGHVPLSKDVVSVMTLLGVFAVLNMTAGAIVKELSGFMRYCLSFANGSIPTVIGSLKDLFLPGLWAAAKSVGPLAAVGVLLAVIGTFVQTRMLVTSEQMKPKFSRLSPLEGFKRLFSLRSLIEVAKNVLKIGLLLIIIYNSLVDMIGESSKYLYVDVAVAGAHLFDGITNLIYKVVLAFAIIAAADFFYQRWSYERDLKMTKEEVKEEFKQQEGDPKIKGKIRQIQRERSMARMIQQVPQADVVIRNPTHYAVALRYKPDRDNAPVVLALGQDELALRIIKVAEENNVAVIENIPLARALYAGVELNHEIPLEFYEAVAEVLVYIFRLNEDKQIVK